MTTESGSRFSDVQCGPPRRLPPIYGFQEKPLVSLKEAIRPIISLVPQVEQMVWTVEGRCTQPKDGLTQNESASIMLYTLEWQPSEKSFYYIFNLALRSEDRRKVTPWFLYLRLLVHSLSKLPLSTPRVIYRGVKLDFSAQHDTDQELIWWSFSSCTRSVSTLETHLGGTGHRIIFNILCRGAVNISAHSCYFTEQEYLLYPGRQFQVRDAWDAGNGLRIIEIE